MLREVTLEEMEFVSGGDIVVTAPTGGLSDADRLYLRQLMIQDISGGAGFQGGGGGGGPVTVPIGEPTPYTPGSTDDLVDTDGDGVADSPELSVIADTQTFDAWKAQAEAFINGLYLSGVGLAGYLGLTGAVGAGAAVGTSAADDAREAAIENLARIWYTNDQADGSLDGAIVPGGYTPPSGDSYDYLMPEGGEPLR